MRASGRARLRGTRGCGCGRRATARAAAASSCRASSSTAPSRSRPRPSPAPADSPPAPPSSYPPNAEPCLPACTDPPPRPACPVRAFRRPSTSGIPLTGTTRAASGAARRDSGGAVAWRRAWTACMRWGAKRCASPRTARPRRGGEPAACGAGGGASRRHAAGPS